VTFIIIIRFRDNLNFIGNKIRRVETDTELSDHGNISSGVKGFHEGFGSGFSDGSEIVD
jgi:hypothetical protein